MARLLAVATVALLLAGCAQRGPATPTEQPAPPSGPGFVLREYATGLDQPLLLTSAHDGTGALYVVEQGGLVWALRNGTRDPAPFLDLRNKTAAGGERGLLGLAFAPDYATSGVLYASYTDLDGDSILERYHVKGGPAPEVVLKVAQPYPNHNGGNVVFGPDGMLWYGLGDGGSGGDPHANGQNPDALLASMLRLDVSPATGYAIPPDNPYANGGGRAEVWAKGLRNPWRFSFDRATGDLWIGDVGQNAWEEIDRVAAPLHGGLDFGWNAFEGTHASPGGAPLFEPALPPVAEYGHDEGCSVTGGYVYRGAAIPALQGTYLFSDACSGHLWGLKPQGSAWNLTRLNETGASIVSFGEDDAGEVYLVDHAGRVLQITPRLVQG